MEGGEDTERHTCDGCGSTYVDLCAHVRENPDCLDCAVPDAIWDSYSYDEPLPDDEPLPAHRLSDALKGRIAFDCLTMRQEFGLSETQMRRLKGFVQEWHDEANEELGIQPPSAVAALHGDGASQPQTLFDGIRSEKTELSRAKLDVPCLEPREAHLSEEPGDVVVSFRVADLIHRKLQHDAAFRKRVLERSDYFKSGVDFEKTPTELEDIADGVEVRYHPKLMRPEQPGEEDHVRLLGLFNADDVEVRAALASADACDRSGSSWLEASPASYRRFAR